MGKKDNEKAGLKLIIQKMKIMAPGLITSWQIKGEKVEAVTDFLFLNSKSTADGDSSQEIKRHLRLGRKALTNLDSLLKSRDVNLPTKVHSYLVFRILTVKYLGMFPLYSSACSLLGILILWMSFISFGKFSAIISTSTYIFSSIIVSLFFLESNYE